MATEQRTVSPIDNPQTLHDEVVADATLTGKYQNLSVKGNGTNNVTFTFSSALTGPEDTALDSLVAGYTDSVTSLPSTSFPSGGSVGQVPLKLSADDFDYDWGDVSGAGLPEKHFFADTSSFSTSSTNFVDAAIDTTPTLTAGKYKLDISFTWQIANTTADAEMNILVDGVAVMFDFWDMEAQDNLNKHPASYVDEVDFTAGDATHIIRLQARSPGGISVTIDDFRYFLIRVE